MIEKGKQYRLHLADGYKYSGYVEEIEGDWINFHDDYSNSNIRINKNHIIQAKPIGGED